jgi:hypothetical protein
MSTKRTGALVATVANPAAKGTTARKTVKASSPKKKTQKPKPKVSKMAKKAKGSSSSKAKKRPRHSNPGNPHAMATVPRGMMLVPKAPTKKKGRRPRRRNPEPAHHTMLKNGAAAVGFGTLAATVGMLGGFALSKANIKNKFGNVAANVATGAIVGGGVGMLDRTAGTVVAHNYMVAAGQWLTAPSSDAASTSAQSRAALGAGAGAGRQGAASPAMLNNRAPAMNAAHEEPDPEAITRPHPAPQYRRQARGMGGPLDHLGSPLDHLGGYDHVEGVLADDVSDPDDVGAFEHLHGILADNLGDDLEAMGDDLDAALADNLGDEELAAEGDVDGADDELGYLPA